MIKHVHLFILLPLLLPLSGCATAVIAGAAAEGAYVATQDRTAGETVSDQWIHTKLSNAYLWDSDISRIDINIDVDKGVVTLKGFVETAEQMKKTVKIAQETKGVVKVINQLHVTP